MRRKMKVVPLLPFEMRSSDERYVVSNQPFASSPSSLHTHYKRTIVSKETYCSAKRDLL
jgi:hypothetical protein